MVTMTESQESDLFPEETMDILMGEPSVIDLMESVADWSGVGVPNIHVGNPTGELPDRTAFVGEHLFDARVDFSGLHKKHYVLSHKLNKLFLDLGKVVPIQIKWDGTSGLFVRALMVFTQADHMKLPVRRCATHRDKDNPTNTRYEHAEHVLASDNENAQYEVDPSSARHSILLPLHLQQGSDHALINLKFMCKTSCTGGLNRSPTDVVFTLENPEREVLGRQIISVKICSCPKRDKEKEEGSLCDTNNKKHKTKVKREEKHTESVDSTKKIKVEHDPDMFPSSFMVTAVSPEVAAMAKEHLIKWSEVKQVEFSHQGVVASPLINIMENVTYIPQPFS